MWEHEMTTKYGLSDPNPDAIKIKKTPSKPETTSTSGGDVKKGYRVPPPPPPKTPKQTPKKPK